MCYAFVLAFMFLALSVCSLNNEVALFCVCVVCFSFFFANKTKWFSGLHLVVLFLCWLFCVQFFVLGYSFLSKKADKKTDTAKTPKTKNAEERTQKKSVSAVVFTNSVPNFVGVDKKTYFAENPIKIVVSVKAIRNF